MLLHDVVSTSRAVAGTRSRTMKVALVADLFSRADPDEVALLATWLAGGPRQRRTGIGWRSLTDLPAPSPEPGLTPLAVDAALEESSHLSGPGSAGARARLVEELFARAGADEQEWLRALVVGDLRQGALDAVVQAATAKVAKVPVEEVRRAAMMAGSTSTVAEAALAAPDPGAALAALARFTLVPGRPVQPMLASSATDVAAALARAAGGADGQPGEVVVDAKLDGIRLQVHRAGGTVTVVTRSLDDITPRLPEVVRLVDGLPGGDLVLDGEGLVVEQGRPVAFQETASRTASHPDPGGDVPVGVTPFFFDVLAADGVDLTDRPLAERLGHLDRIVPPQHRTRRLHTSSSPEADEFLAQVLADGHEGVVVKDAAAPYAAGRRGAAWVKVKPVHTLDLVVLAVERGSGRRQGWLSTIHLGARDHDAGDFVMVGKTFKGMTDEMLRWQTERFTALSLDPPTEPDDWTVRVRPEQVVEIAVDGVQRSTRYPGGVALRFARVVRYRDDKSAAEADTIDTVRALGH